MLTDRNYILTVDRMCAPALSVSPDEFNVRGEEALTDIMPAARESAEAYLI